MDQLSLNGLKKIAEAAVKGMKMVKGRRGTYLDTDRKGEPCRACEVGTILLGLGTPFTKEGCFDLRDLHTSVLNRMVPEVFFKCPDNICPDRCEFRIGTMAEHLFELHHWARPRIARYLERLVKEHDKEA